MHRIERYRALCADGRTIDEQRTLNHQGRWKPSTIVRLEWECNGRPVEISHIYGLMAQLLPDRSGVAILRASLRSRFSPALELIEPDGETRFTLESPIRIEDQDVAGEFAWFEAGADVSPRPKAAHAVRTVFWSVAGDRYFLLDVDAQTGVITAVMPLQ
jgi:hypothetical protein